MSTFEGKFADYLAEGELPEPIELKTSGNKKIVLKVPTKKQLKAYFAALDEPVDVREEAVWRALLVDNYDSVMDWFDDRPFPEWRRFETFVQETWFGRGSTEVEGK